VSLTWRIPHIGAEAIGATPVSNTRRASGLECSCVAASVSASVRFAPALSPAMTSLFASAPKDDALATTHAYAALTSSNAAGNGCVGANR
jgi:hypothetical protein